MTDTCLSRSFNCTSHRQVMATSSRLYEDGARVLWPFARWPSMWTLLAIRAVADRVSAARLRGRGSARVRLPSLLSGALRCGPEPRPARPWRGEECCIADHWNALDIARSLRRSLSEGVRRCPDVATKGRQHAGSQARTKGQVYSMHPRLCESASLLANSSPPHDSVCCVL